MRRKLVSLYVLTVLLVFTFSTLLRVHKVEASGTIYIRADGSIDPPTAPISTVDNVTYTLTGNITSDDGGIVVERSNIVVDGAGYTVQGAETSTGFGLAADNVTVRNACVQKFRYGIVISSSGCTIINNVITYNVKWGVYLGGSDNRIISNRIANTGLNLVGYDIVGIYCGYGSDNNTIADNHIEKNGHVGSGILLYRSSDNAITGNNITNHDCAGIYLDTLSGNVICYNNFINNYYQVYGYYSANTWDGGYPSGGNYWSNYAGVDLESGFYQNETGSDGIGDIPYVIGSANQDNYPLMHPWSSLPVHNINTGVGYVAIQEAINAPETLDRHTIFVEAGTYYENVVVNKTVSIIGESRATTLIDGNRTAEAVIITANNTLLTGFTIQSSDSFIVAVRLENVSHTTIANNTVTNSFSGLVVAFSDFNTIAGNNITKNTFRDAFVNSSNNILRDNTMEGLYISKSNNNTLVGNTIGSFMLSYSPDTTLRNNSFSVLGVYGDTLSHFVQDTDSSNTVSGKPVYYWVNRENAEIPSDAGYVALINCINITARGLNLENSSQDIIMFSTNNSRILNNNVTNINEGIWISSSSNNAIYGNNITSSLIQLLNGCSNNSIFHNNFINAGVDSYKSTNAWDDGYPSGGNYWSNYTGVDLCSSPNQTVTGSDSIGDTPYVIDEDNVDNYPLMAPYGTFDAGTWDGTAYNVDVISNSTVSGLQFNPSEGALLRFNVTGEDGTSGFCRVTIPKDLLWVEDGWTVLYGSYPLSFETFSDENYTYLYFTYTNPSQNGFTTVTINGTHVILEFLSFLIIPSFFMATLLAVIVYRRKQADRR
jgi:parallel beta-helix repeat protein